MTEFYIEDIYKVITKDPGHRGITTACSTIELESAAKELIQAKRVLIITGFCIKDFLTGETDGPIGAISLAAALEKLGKDVRLVTDMYSEMLVKACCKVRGVKANVEIIQLDDSEETSKARFNEFSPTHVVAIERPGRAMDNRYYSMYGEDISDVIPDTDIFFILAKEKGVVTIGVGDGGNELGMGKIRPTIVAFVRHGERICAKLAADYLIPSGVSNWGGHGLVAALSIMSSKQLLHDRHTEKKMLKAILEAGGIDGCKRNKDLSVDGVSLFDNLLIIDALRQIIDTYIVHPAKVHIKNLISPGI